ncbi:hypothetical protein ACVMB3_005077 [Sinorhizobium meliloti]
METFSKTVAKGLNWLLQHIKPLAATGSMAIAGVIFTSLFWTTPARLWDGYVLVPLKEIIQGIRPNISEEEAFRVGRLHVGSGVVKAIPFRNVDDPNQLIAVWSDALSVCGDTDCPFGAGAIQLTLLSGGPTYEKIETKIFAVEPYYPVEIERLSKFYPLYFDVIDRDSDGSKEIISFTEQAGMTASHREWILNLFDTKTSAIAQLKVMESRTDRTSPVTGTDDPLLKSWLRERFEEFQENLWRTECSRTRKGGLTCQAEMTGDGPFLVHDNDPEENGAQRDALEKWVEDNGVNFTFGKIRLRFSSDVYSSISENPDCRIVFGNRRIDIEFRGDIYISDLDQKSTSVLYVQDGKHHSSVRSVIVGRKYIWIGLAASKKLIVIDKGTMESLAMDIPEWDELVKTPDFFLPNDTKDVQLDELGIKNGKLYFSDIELSPILNDERVPLSEFARAQTCE